MTEQIVFVYSIETNEFSHYQIIKGKTIDEINKLIVEANERKIKWIYKFIEDQDVVKAILKKESEKDLTDIKDEIIDKLNDVLNDVERIKWELNS